MIDGIETIAPTDNLSELTARENDEGLETVYMNSLLTSRLKSRNMVFEFSSGGRSNESNISAHKDRSLRYSLEGSVKICGLVD